MADAGARASKREAAVVAASTFIHDGDAVIVGQGLPVLAALFAKHDHAKKSVIINEYGVVDTDPPIAVELAHPLLAETAVHLCDMVDALAVMIRHLDIAMLGAAQIDRFGNINTTSVGDYARPKARISGSGGANDIGSLAKEFVVVMDRQSKAKFPEKVDYVTTPGFFGGGPRAREKQRLPGRGPVAVVTDLGIYRFTPRGELYLHALQPGVSFAEVKENTSWRIRTSDRLKAAASPKEDQVALLRSLDPRKVYLN